ncbi:hypothetical protein GCM10020254_41100 [Streptomyces goshikiensis]
MTERPQQDMQITKPLIRKNSCTPSQPYEAIGCAVGKITEVDLPHTGVDQLSKATKWKATTISAATSRSPSSV